MTLTGFLILLLVALVAGSIGQALAGYSLGGCLISAVVGIIGAYIGLGLANLLALPVLFPIQIQGEAFPLIWSIIGSMVFTLVIGLLTRRGAIPRY